MLGPVTKTQQFREILGSDKLEFIMEAHNGLSARIVEETGFKGIWASGLSISAALGVRDNNEASWTQVLEVCEFMADATNIPILLDGDTGYGNFNNMRRLVTKLEQRGIAAVCIEDKLFPKTNSFINSERQPLADMDEFAGKIKAAKDGQSDPDFAVIARLEAFIAGWGLDEMLRRAEAYHAAGADGLLIHSKKSTPDQILAFAKEWAGRSPIVIVPTMYYSTPTEVFEQAGIDLVIWANHNVRSAIRAMQDTSRRIFEERSLLNVEDEVVSVKEVFRLQDADELASAEGRYLPANDDSVNAIVMAATRGDELRELTAEKPKTMIEIHGRPILHRLVEQFRKERIRNVTVIRGFGKEHVQAPDVRFVDNDDFASTGELYTLNAAAGQLTGEMVISFGDILFRRYILSSLLDTADDIAIAVDATWTPRGGDRLGFQDLIRASKPHSLNYTTESVWLEEMSPELAPSDTSGEWIGLMKTSPKGSTAIRESLTELAAREDFRALHLHDLFEHLIARGERIRVVYITGHWLDVDNLEDLALAQAF
ncbi:MAG: phosphoenolpyruvate mutase [Verrucomicrobiae bacterium]|nr:phosphoenolpyruvate mutase [Verrucomicrobiae bacterium]